MRGRVEAINLAIDFGHRLDSFFFLFRLIHLSRLSSHVWPLWLPAKWPAKMGEDGQKQLHPQRKFRILSPARVKWKVKLFIINEINI